MKNDKYFLYARKSTEGDERQIQSIDDQLKVMRKKAHELGIEIVHEFIESKSAKIPHNRVIFSEMLGRLEKKEADGIIAWELNRLSRNPVDSGIIQYMLQKGSLQGVVTNSRKYTEKDSGLLMSVENGMSNQFILDLIVNVKRGQNTKYEQGIRPSKVPIGYLNEKAERTIITDEARFPIVRQMWDLMLTGNYSIRKTIDKANKDWGLRTVKTKNRGGGELAKSSGERIFRNIFYTGYFYRGDELIKGIHKPMISLDEFDRVQKLLGRKNAKSRPKTREFSYTGMIRCGTCGCMVTAEAKSKYIKSTGETKGYTYYHCTKKKKELKCREGSILIEKLENQIRNILESIEIDTDFKKWIFDAIKENYNSEFEAREKIYNSIVSSIAQEERKKKKLLNFLLEDESFTRVEYNEKKKEIQESIVNLTKKRDSIDLKGKKTLENTEQVFDFTFELVKSFNSGSLQEKKNIFSTLGKNFTLKDGVLAVELEPWFQVIQTEYPKLIREFRRLEPTKKDTSNDLLSVSGSNYIQWWVIRGSNPGPSP